MQALSFLRLLISYLRPAVPFYSTGDTVTANICTEIRGSSNLVTHDVGEDYATVLVAF